MNTNTMNTSLQKLQPQFLQLAYISLVGSAFFSALSVTGTNISMTVAAISCLLSGKFFAQWPYIKSNPIFRAIVLLLLILAVGMFWSIGSWHDRWSAFHKYAKLLYIPLLVPLCFDALWRRRSINAFLAAMLLTVVLSFLKQFGGVSWGEETLSSWVFHGHIETSYFVAFAAYVFAYRLVYEQRYRAGYMLLILLFSYQEFFINDSRTGWMVYFSLLLLFCVQSASILVSRKYAHKPRMLYLAGLRGLLYAFVVISGLVILSYSFSSAFHENVNEAAEAVIKAVEGRLPTDAHRYVSSSEFRLLFIKFSLNLVRDHPVLGLGTGSFQQAYRDSPGIPGWWSDELNNPHNEYLLILVQLGAVGLLALLYLFFTQLRAGWQQTEDNFLALGFLFSFLVACCYNSFLYLTITGHFYVLFSSVLFASYFYGLKHSAFFNSIEAK